MRGTALRTAFFMTQIKTMKKVMTTTKLAGQKKNKQTSRHASKYGSRKWIRHNAPGRREKNNQKPKKVDQRPKGKKTSQPRRKSPREFFFSLGLLK
jgi:hypothetical protein